MDCERYKAYAEDRKKMRYAERTAKLSKWTYNDQAAQALRKKLNREKYLH